MFPLLINDHYKIVRDVSFKKIYSLAYDESLALGSALLETMSPLFAGPLLDPYLLDFHFKQFFHRRTDLGLVSKHVHFKGVLVVVCTLLHPLLGYERAHDDLVRFQLKRCLRSWCSAASLNVTHGPVAFLTFLSCS